MLENLPNWQCIMYTEKWYLSENEYKIASEALKPFSE